MIGTVATVGAGYVFMGACIGTGFSIAMYLKGLAHKAYVWGKAQFGKLTEQIKARIDRAFIKIDEIAKRYPEVTWTEKLQVELAKVFARLAWGTKADQFMQIISAQKAEPVKAEPVKSDISKAVKGDLLFA